MEEGDDEEGVEEGGGEGRGGGRAAEGDGRGVEKVKRTWVWGGALVVRLVGGRGLRRVPNW